MGRSTSTFLIVLLGLLSLPAVANAGLIDQVNQAWREVYGRNPTQTEWFYWAGRVQRGEKKNYKDLVGGIAYQKGAGAITPASTSLSSSVQAGSFKIEKKFYPSAINANFLPDGTMVKSPTSPEVFYIRNGKKSWITPSVINKWFNENHFLKHDVILTISATDLARYPQTSSVNPIYIGKILRHPNGTQYFIDDKLRKRQISDAVKAAFKIPAGNLYSTSAIHLSEFKTGPAITNTNKYPGGVVVYSGAYHGGRIWRIKESAGGALTKHLYLSDYLYEADGNPDESLRAPADPARLASHTRGSNIEKYPDGWVVGLSGGVYVVQNDKLRLIATPQILAAMGYKSNNILKVFPEFLKRYPHGEPIRGFKSVTAGGAAATKGAPKAAPDASSNLTKVRPHIRTLISQVNDLYLAAYDKEPTTGENKFWVDYVYNGEVNNKSDLMARMKTAAATGKKPSRTSRTAAMSEKTLENHWFPYLFYFVHQSEPADADRIYWFNRIHAGDRNTIEKLGGTLQWVKDNLGATRR